MKKVTIEDISRETGLSRGTVSRALNDRPDISAKTRQTVLAACQKLNYVPNHAARTLATGRSYVVAFLAEDLRCAYAGDVLRGVTDRAEQSGYVIQVREMGASPTDAIGRVLQITPDRIDAMIIVGHEPLPQGAQLRDRLGARPLVSTTGFDGADADVLGPDYAESGRLVGRHLLQAGARELLYVRHGGSRAGEDRWRGFQEVCAAAGAAARQEVLEPGEPVDVEPRVQEAIRSVPAAAGDTDTVAAGLLIAALRAGRAVGREIRIAGQGNTPFSAALAGGITTTDYSGYEIGTRAFTTLLGRIQGERTDTVQQVQVAPTLIVRGTTAASNR